MGTSLSRAAIVKVTDPHGWNSYDHYRTIHEKRLAEHPFLDDSRPNTIKFQFIELDGVLYLHLEGRCFCNRDAILEVEKIFETRYSGRTLQIRGVLYRYIAWVRGSNPILKYHNLHENRDEFIHRVYNPNTGHETLYEFLTRSQFPLFSEVLDEMELIAGCLKS